MQSRRVVVALGALLVLAASACIPFGGFVYDLRLGGPYRLVAVDTMDQMIVCRDMGTLGDCVGDMLPSATVFAAGIDDEHLVIGRRVTREPFVDRPANYGEIEFYYVVRTADEAEPAGLRQENIIGPLTQSEFESAKAEFDLPEFSRVFDELRTGH